jgi:transposase
MEHLTRRARLEATMNTQHYVRLTAAERAELGALIRREHASTFAQTHARILLLADSGQTGPRLTDREIAAAIGVEVRTVARVRSQFARDGLAAALQRRPRGDRRPRKLEGAQEAQLIALACSDPPPGHARWSLRLLSQRLVELEVVDGIAPETVRQALKKTTLNHG